MCLLSGSSTAEPHDKFFERGYEVMKVLVTGGAGFIGSHLVRALLAAGHDVRIVDNLSTGKQTNLTPVAKEVELVLGDIRDEAVARKSVVGRELIFHQAALPSVPRSVKDPRNSVDNNVLGTVVLLKAAVDAGVRRVIYAGSSSAYGNCAEDPKVETITPRVLSPYAASKLAGESLLQAFSSCYGLETIVTRYFNVFGERQDAASQYSGVIAKFCKCMLANESPVVFGDGLHSRDFTYVGNVVKGNLCAAEADAALVSGEVFNIACGGSITLNNLVDEINQILGAELRPRYEQSRVGDILHSRADIRKAERLLGYKPVLAFSNGLRRTIEWYASDAKDAPLARKAG